MCAVLHGRWDIALLTCGDEPGGDAWDLAEVNLCQLCENVSWPGYHQDHYILQAYSPDSRTVLCAPAACLRSDYMPAAFICASTAEVVSCQQQYFLSGSVTDLVWSSTGQVALHLTDICSSQIVLCSVYGDTPRLRTLRKVDTTLLASGLCVSPAGLICYIEHGSNMPPLFGRVNIVRVVHAASGRRVTVTALPDTHSIWCRTYSSCPAHKQLPSVDAVWSKDGSCLFVCGPQESNAGGLVDKGRFWPVQSVRFGVSGQGVRAVLANQVPSINHRVRLTGLPAFLSFVFALVLHWWCPPGVLRLAMLLLMSRHFSGAKWWCACLMTIAVCALSSLGHLIMTSTVQAAASPAELQGPVVSPTRE